MYMASTRPSARNDPELSRLLQIAGWLWLGYLAMLMLVNQILYQTVAPMLLYYLVNGCAALLFIAISYIHPLQRLLKGSFLPLMLLLIAVMPVVINHLRLFIRIRDSLSSPEWLALSQMPVLFLALVLTAWQYRFAGVAIFSGVTFLVELLMVIFVSPLLDFVSIRPPELPGVFSPTPFRAVDIFIVLAVVRTISFLVVGYFISQLMSRLRLQQESLARANTRLTHYSSTIESLTVSRERNRIAHELHDTLAHSLTAIAVQLEAVKAYWELDAGKARRLLDSSLASARSGTEETRRALKALRATPLEDLGLKLALQELAVSAARRASLDLELHLPEDIPFLSPDVEQVLYRIAQEAIENVVNHAQAHKLIVSLAGDENRITLTVADDGLGFDPVLAEKAGRYGLIGMRERAAIAGCGLKVESAPANGTRITLTMGA